MNHTKHQEHGTTGQSVNESSMSGAMRHGNQYKRLLWMMVLSFIAMFILMYAMVDKFANVIPNLNQFYMAGLMSAPMLIIEIVVMRKMYPNKKMNLIALTAGVVLLAGFYIAIRKQTAIGDKQFLKSMIPHHAGAILMVKESNLKDPEVKKLAQDIIDAQNSEIEFMKRKIKELANK